MKTRSEEKTEAVPQIERGRERGAKLREQCVFYIFSKKTKEHGDGGETVFFLK